MSSIRLDHSLVYEIFEYLDGLADGVEDAPKWARDANELANRLAYELHCAKVKVHKEPSCTE